MVSQQLPPPAWGWTCCSGDSASQRCWELPHCQPATSPMHPITLFHGFRARAYKFREPLCRRHAIKSENYFITPHHPCPSTSNLSPWDYATQCVCAHAQDKSHTQSNSGRNVLFLQCPLFRKRWPCNMFSSIKFSRSKLLKFRYLYQKCTFWTMKLQKFTSIFQHSFSANNKPEQKEI